MADQRTPLQRAGLLAGPLLGIASWWLLAPNPEAAIVAGELSQAGAITLAMAIWMVVWWISEATSIYVTSLLPMLVLPITGSMELKSVSVSWGHPIIFLTLGGFALAAMLERWGLHERFAKAVLRVTGNKPRQIIAAFMVVGAVLSMWISNTSAAILMLPIALGVLSRVPKKYAGKKDFSAALLLGIAHSCSVGGMTTLIGTSTNMFFLGFAADELGYEIGFLAWMLRMIPLALVFLPTAWWILTRIVFKVEAGELSATNFASDLAQTSQPWSRGTRLAAAAFVLIAGAWIAAPFLKGVPGLGHVDSYVIGIGAMFIVFAFPTGEAEAPFLLDWTYAVKRIPWGVLLIIGGGLALAKAISQFGVGEYIAGHFSGIEHLPTVVLVAICTLLMVFLTEITTNVASVTALSPIIVALGVAAGLDPMVLIVPVTMAASFAFMLPVATPPNAVVFGSGELGASQMARAGFLLNLVAVVLIVLWSVVMPTF